MRCPFCGEVSNRVIDSRLTRDSQEIRRRRECDECARRFTTRERIEEIQPKIVKRDERREEYERAKLEHSVQKACAKRPVSEHAVQRLVDRVERLLPEAGEAEVSTDYVGRLVLEELMVLDPMAAARFASVFQRFGSAQDYVEFFASMEASSSDSSSRDGESEGDS
jgi:transcriptional repressor NrdR